jgi:translation initiation factor IF-1
MSADKMELTGEIIEANKSIFKVRVSDNHIITARLSGKIRINNVHILVGDTVIVEVSPYDMSSGRITYRTKN